MPTGPHTARRWPTASRWHARLTGLVFAALMSTGCLAGSDIVFDTEPKLFMGGGHLRWINNESVEFEGYLVNMHNETVDFEFLRLAGWLECRGDSYRYDHWISPGSAWPAGEARQGNVYWTVAPQEPCRPDIAVDEHHGWWYGLPCQLPGGERSSDCGRTDISGLSRITSDNETEWYPKLIACCNWLPPPFDVYDLECRFDGVDVVCTFIVWNYTQDTYEGSVEVLLSTSLIDEPTVVSRQSVPFGAPLGPRETREFETRFTDLAEGWLSEPGIDISVEARAARLDYPKSHANETTTVPIESAAETTE